MSGKHIHLQPLGGIAGDMFVAAMLDAFPDCREQVFADIAAILPGSVGTARLTSVLKNGIAALHFSLDERRPSAPHAPASLAPETKGTSSAKTDSSPDRHYRQSNAPNNRFASSKHHNHSHQDVPVGNYAEVRKLIEGARLSESAAVHALSILEILASAESHIHCVAMGDVHFHELAAWDSIIDVVGAGSVIAALGEATWSISALPLGSGQVRTQHGLLPVPAPATMRILERYPWHSDNVPGERVTPTGAAIVRYLIPPERLSDRPEGILFAGGYGAGTKNFSEMPNVLRVMVFDKARESSGDGTNVIVVEFDIDDMSGEEVGVAAERLRSAEGVLDLLLIAAQGKKGRPVTMFRLLIAPAYLEQCSRLVFEETSTIGLRWNILSRMVLPRVSRRTGGGLRVKEVVRPNGTATTKIESDELEPLGGLTTRRRIKATAEGSL